MFLIYVKRASMAASSLHLYILALFKTLVRMLGALRLTTIARKKATLAPRTTVRSRHEQEVKLQ